MKAGTREKIEDAVEACRKSFRADLYIDIMGRLRTDGRFTPVTQVAFEDFYGFRYARVGQEWKERYFDYANQCIHDGGKPSFEEAFEKIGVYYSSLQPSLASKLVATLNENAPIYDSNVRFFLSIASPNHKDIELRKKYIEGSYHKIEDFYSSGEYYELRMLMKAIFLNCVEVNGHISDTKIVDYVVWALGIQKIRLADIGE